jgi:hypothetical protein
MEVVESPKYPGAYRRLPVGKHPWGKTHHGLRVDEK